MTAHCAICGERMMGAIIYGPFVILACDKCFIEKVAPGLPDEAILNRAFNAIPVQESEFR